MSINRMTFFVIYKAYSIKLLLFLIIGNSGGNLIYKSFAPKVNALRRLFLSKTNTNRLWEGNNRLYFYKKKKLISYI